MNSESAGLAGPSRDERPMNFRDLANQIVMRMNEEKWYETRDGIQEALEWARAQGCTDGWLAHAKTMRRAGIDVLPLIPLALPQGDGHP